MAPAKTSLRCSAVVTIGVLSALPVINLANCCCAWILFGGALAAYLMQQNHPEPIQVGDGAIVGLLAGVIGAFVWLIVSIPISVVMAPLQSEMAQRMLRNASDMPPELRRCSRACQGGPAIGLGLLFGFFVMLVVSTLFGMLGGLFGALMFRKSSPPVVPPPIPPEHLLTRRMLAAAEVCTRYALARPLIYFHSMSEPVSPEIEALLKEDRSFAPSDEFRSRALVNDPAIYAQRREGSRSVLGGLRERARVDQAVVEGARVEPAGCEVVRRRQAQRQRQLPRSPRAHRAPQQGGVHLGRRARRSPHADLFRSLSPGLPVRERPEVARREARAIASRCICR